MQSLDFDIADAVHNYRLAWFVAAADPVLVDSFDGVYFVGVCEILGEG